MHLYIPVRWHFYYHFEFSIKNNYIEDIETNGYIMYLFFFLLANALNIGKERILERTLNKNTVLFIW